MQPGRPSRNAPPRTVDVVDEVLGVVWVAQSGSLSLPYPLFRDLIGRLTVHPGRGVGVIVRRIADDTCLCRIAEGA